MDGWWDIDHVFRMVRDAQDDVSAFLIAAQAITPAELRHLAATVDVEDIDNLRDLSLLVTCKVRRIGDEEHKRLRAWVLLWSRDRRKAAEQYLRRVI